MARAPARSSRTVSGGGPRAVPGQPDGLVGAGGDEHDERTAFQVGLFGCPSQSTLGILGPVGR